MSEAIEEQATDEHRGAGLDVADFFLMKATPHEILADMIRRNVAVKLLVDKLGLEICNEEESHYTGSLPWSPLVTKCACRGMKGLPLI